MKSYNLTKLAIILSIVIGFGSSVSASSLQKNSDGIMELPTFYIYASDADEAPGNANMEAVQWTFENAIDSSADPVAIQVIVPGEELVQVNTPAISTSLVKS